MLQRLDRRGLVRRRLDARDKRRTVIYIEPKGVELFEQILPIGRRQIERAIGACRRPTSKRLQGLAAPHHGQRDRAPDW